MFHFREIPFFWLRPISILYVHTRRVRSFRSIRSSYIESTSAFKYFILSRAASSTRTYSNGLLAMMNLHVRAGSPYVVLCCDEDQ
jgi:hypothetical protein